MIFLQIGTYKLSYNTNGFQGQCERHTIDEIIIDYADNML